MAYRAAVVGGSGYTGVELLRLLAVHPEIEVVTVTAASNAGARVSDLYPSLSAAVGDLDFVPFVAAEIAGVDVAFCCLPHGESQRIVGDLCENVSHVVDLAADFRLPADVYARWYGEPHSRPSLLGDFAYGMTELYRDDLEHATHVAAPGCYPTAASLALAPLLSGGFVLPTGIIVNATSGVSGAGRALKTTSLFAEAGEQVSAYGLLDHRHTAEIEQALSHVAGTSVEVLFQPHLAPMTRGILASCYAQPAVGALDTASLLAHYREYYADDPFVIVRDEPSGTRATYGSNAAHVTVRYDDRTGTVIAFGTIDNLVKGASGQAIQDTNILLGLPETTGLTAIGIAP